MNQRRDFFSRVAAVGAGLWAGNQAAAQTQHEHHQQKAPAGAPPPAKGRPSANLPVELPDLGKLPHRVVDGVKEFHLVAEVVKTEIFPGRPIHAWGFNGSVPGPMLEFHQGDRVRVIFENRLPEMSALHWHGFEVPMEMDGSVGVGQDPVPPGGKYVYEFTLDQHGTLFYHSHFAMQEMMGMLGMVIVHPRKPYEPAVDRDFGLILQEWALLPNNPVPNTLSMEFNWLTFNGKSGPACTPLLVKQGERVRIRMINIGMDHHPIHMHGHQFAVTGTEAGRKPEHLWFDENTVLVGVAQARNIEFVAKYTGDWMLHCHLPHHMMNQMMSMVGPISHGGRGMPAGGSMTDGMGIYRQGAALAEEKGAALGRGIGLGAGGERPVSNLVAATGHHHDHSGAGGEAYPKDDPEKKKVPGYPQDMWMVMDHLFHDKPENHGLRPGWSGAMMGMMTLVRVLPEDKYEQIMALKRAKGHKHGA